MKPPKLSPADLAIFVSILLLNGLSIYTTQAGLALVLPPSPARLPIALAFSLALGLFLIGITLDLAFTARATAQRWRRAAIYLFLASISILFNFNFFFNVFAASSVEGAEYQELRALRDKVVGFATQERSRQLELQHLQERIAAASAGTQFEVIHPTEPGPGPRYAGHLETQTYAKQLLQARQEDFAAFQGAIEKHLAASPPFSAPDFPDYETARAYSTALRSNLVSLLSRLQGEYGIAIPLSDQDRSLLRDPGRRTDLSYSLGALMSQFSSPTSESMRIGGPRLLLCALLAMVLDLPIFIAVFLLRNPNRKEPGPPSSSSAGGPIFEKMEQMFDL